MIGKPVCDSNRICVFSPPALTVRFICRRFLSEYDPTLEDTYVKDTKVAGSAVRLHILDTAGEVRKIEFVLSSRKISLRAVKERLTGG